MIAAKPAGVGAAFEVPVLRPDVDGESRPKVVEFLKDRARVAAVECGGQVAEECVHFGVVGG